MPSPIQVILNQENFEGPRENSGGGGFRKDFFAHRDEAFRQHRQGLVDQLNSLAAMLEKEQQGEIGVIKVILRRGAWAKSHRPIAALFNPDQIPLVGGGDLGEMYFEARPTLLRQIAHKVTSAEDNTTLKRNPSADKLLPNPSAVRSETGAIKRIELYGPSDRRRFSVEEAVSWLANPMTGASYEVELFEVPPPRARWDAVDEGRRHLYETFVAGLAEIGRGLEVQRLRSREPEHPQLRVHVGRSAEPPVLRLQAADGSQHTQEIAPFDPDMARHRRLLTFLDTHPLVRHIELPPVIVRSERKAVATQVRTRPEAVELPVRSTTRTYPKIGVIDGGVGAPLADWVIERWEVLADEHMDHDHGTLIGGLAVGGSALNGADLCPEPDGAEIVDISVFPGRPEAFQDYYPQGPDEFFDEVGNAVADAKARHDTRVQSQP